jgi:dipeptidyl aminopeptidase/acylaminoacyl peptidase
VGNREERAAEDARTVESQPSILRTGIIDARHLSRRPDSHLGRAVRKPPLSVEALWAIKRIAAPTLSPDGSHACAAVTSFDMGTNESTTELWLFPTGLAGKAGAKARRLTGGDKDSDPKWSPSGDAIAFTAKRKDDEEPQIYVIAPDGGEARRVTTLATGCSAIKWFADGKRIAFVSWVWPDLKTDAEQAKRKKEKKDDKVKAHVTERAEFRFWDHWLTDGREPHVFVCDVATGRCRDALAGTGIALCPWEPKSDDFDISPDGRELALSVDLGPEQRMMALRDIVTVDLATKRKRVLTDKSGTDDATPVYAPDGHALVYHAFDTERSFNDQGHLVLRERASGRTPHAGAAARSPAAARRVGARFELAPVHSGRPWARRVVAAVDARSPMRMRRRWPSPRPEARSAALRSRAMAR